MRHKSKSAPGAGLARLFQSNFIGSEEKLTVTLRSPTGGGVGTPKGP